MDIIYECAARFVILKDYEYIFTLAKNRKITKLKLNFTPQDFFHIAGLQHLKDIAIPKNKPDILKNIIEKRKITDSLIQKSRFYNHPKSDLDINSRIHELLFLEEYLDTNNFIRIYNTRGISNPHSLIRADYIIESKFKVNSDIVYIFLRQREENPEYYCIVSFFKKGNITYGGDILYWMKKEKISHSSQVILYQHPDYKE